MWDRTQGCFWKTPFFFNDFLGPAASVSAGAAAIARVHAAFFKEGVPPQQWAQNDANQVNFLGQVSEHFPMKNGYVCLSESDPQWPSQEGNSTSSTPPSPPLSFSFATENSRIFRLGSPSSKSSNRISQRCSSKLCRKVQRKKNPKRKYREISV